MALLHEGPSKSSHLEVDSEQYPLQQITQEEPTMLSLQRMHQIGAAQPRAQAKFDLLMAELKYRYLIGLERLHIGRLTLASPLGPRHDNYVTSLQPSFAPGSIDL